MKIIDTVAGMKAFIKENSNKSVGLVPTMGYLHEGHLSLIRKSVSQNDITAVSIFVNPTQFGAGEDFEKYPRDLARDAAAAEGAGADVIFCPSAAQMYPDGYKTYLAVEDITSILCGKTRPTHFRGVTTVVAKLFNIVSPARAYFGQKDAQQLAVIMRMTEDMNFDTEIVPCPIVREEDGLAMSSRNCYLSEEERKKAPVIYRSLTAAADMYAAGERDAQKLVGAVRRGIDAEESAQAEYIEAVKFPSLEPCGERLEEKTLIAAAVRFGGTRLIDNIILS